jgi:hypothetical protein
LANVGAFAQVGILNMVNLSATTTRPTGWGVSLSTGSPGSASPFPEVAVGSGYSRQTCSWGSAIAGGTAFNVSAMTFGPFSSNCNISGIAVIDTMATPGLGNVVWYGLLATPRAITVGDSLIIAASALTSQVL